jgi:hypothetical protein
LFALTLLVSAVAKALGPRAAAAGLLWTHLDQSLRVAIVVGGILLETLVGGLLLVGGRCRAVLWSGAGLAAALLVLHAIGLARSPSACGCFGDLALPDAVPLALSLLGLIGCAAAARSANARASWQRFAAVLMLSFVAPGLAVTRLGVIASAEEELRSTLAVGPDEHAVAIVGTWSCDDCQRVLQSAVRTASGERLFFVTRVSDQHPAAVPDQRFVLAAIPDHLWWRLVVATPPRIVRFGNLLAAGAGR